jgi:hypothetical protein
MRGGCSFFFMLLECYIITGYKLKSTTQLWYISWCMLVTYDRSLVASTNKTDRHDITEILLKLKVALNTLTLHKGIHHFNNNFLLHFEIPCFIHMKHVISQKVLCFFKYWTYPTVHVSDIPWETPISAIMWSNVSRSQ